MTDTAVKSFNRTVDMLSSPVNMSCAEWADEYFKLSPEASNTSGDWKTTTVQTAILNSFGSDAIEKVDFYKPARFGGTKMCVIAHAYHTTHHRRNVGFYQPTKGASDAFVKNEIQPSIRDCEPWADILISNSDKSPDNTISYKAFKGCNAYYRGGHSANAFRMLTLDTVILDEIDGFQSDVDGEGDPTTLSWGRIKNSVFKKQIQISTPTVKGFSLIEKSSESAEDIMRYHVECPNCQHMGPIEWGGADVPYGFVWEKGRPETVLHYCPECGEGWGNAKLSGAVDAGYWEGETGIRTRDGITWTLGGDAVAPPRHVAFQSWAAYSPFSTWQQIVEEWLDALGDIDRQKTFTNITLGRTWDLNYQGSQSAQAIEAIIPIEDLSDIVLVTSGSDVQDDRHETQYIGWDRAGNMTVLDYEIVYADMSDRQTYIDLAHQVLEREFPCGASNKMKVGKAAIDTQGHHTPEVHAMLKYAGTRFIGINGSGTARYDVNAKPSHSGGDRKKVFYTIGTNILKQAVYSAIQNFDKDKNALRIAAVANLPEDYAKQLTAERMDTKKGQIVFTNPKGARNEALDTAVYALAAKKFIKVHGGYGEKKQYDQLFGGD